MSGVFLHFCIEIDKCLNARNIRRSHLKEGKLRRMMQKKKAVGKSRNELPQKGEVT